jgi:hypothetical protein
VDANADNNLTLEITSKNKQTVHIYQYKLLLYLTDNLKKLTAMFRHTQDNCQNYLSLEEIYQLVSVTF